MPVPTSITQLNVNEALNSPLGTENVGSPGSVDNYFRAIQAIIRRESLAKSWEVRGDVPSYIDADSFSVPGDQLSYYRIGRRVQAIGATTVYGTISDNDFNGTITTVDLTLDSGTLDPTLSAVYLGVDPASAAAEVGVKSFNTRIGDVVLTAEDIVDPTTGALGYTPANAAGQAFAGGISASTGGFSDGVASSSYQQIVEFPTLAAGSHALDFYAGQSKVVTLSGNVVLDLTSIPVGSIMRLAIINTNFTITWPATVAWPMGVAPSLAAGPLDKAIVVLECILAGGGANTILGSATVY